MDELDSWLTLVDVDCKIDLLLVVGAAGVGSTSTVTVASLICTRACGDATMLAILLVLLAMVGCWSMPVGEASGVMWWVISAGGARSHGFSSPSSCVLSCMVVGLSASRTLLNQATGRLISAIRGLTLTGWEDLASRLGLCSFGVAVVAMMALLVGLSLEIKVHVVTPMVATGLGVEST